MATPSTRSRTYGTPFVLSCLIGLIVGQLLLALMLIGVFHSPTLHGLPIAIVGNGATTEAIAGPLEASGAFTVTAVPSGSAARKLIDNREVYGAYAPRARAGHVLTASAASPAVAGVLQQTFVGVDRQRRATTVVTDVKPLPPDDSAGVSGYLLVLVAALLGIIFAWLLELRVPSITRGPGAAIARIAVLATFAILSGLTLAVLTTSFGALEGHLLAVAAALALLSFAVASTTCFITALLGGPLGLIAPLVIFVLVGILVGSGATSAPEFLPDFWRAAGAALPPRAGIDLIRNTTYFENAPIGTPLLVLGMFSLGGASLMLALSAARSVVVMPLGSAAPSAA